MTEPAPSERLTTQLPRRAVVVGGGWGVFATGCAAETTTTWSDVEEASGLGLVLIRRGAFVRDVNNEQETVDAGSAYFERAGVAQRFRHLRPGGDECTFVPLHADWVDDVADSERVPLHSITITPDIALWHRAVRSPAAQDDPTGHGAESMMRLVAATVRTVTARPPHRSDRPSHRRLAYAARDQLLNTSPGEVTLAIAAKALDVSPWHLSRTFAAVHGATFSEFRNTLRIQAVVDRLAGGETDLASLAHDFGFTDHAHLTRTVSKHLHAAPRQIRSLLSEAGTVI